ncbi:MAG: M48 family metallopeptidase [Candidatus Eisenbacteria bacterium]
MNFFEHQDQARRSTTRLVVLFSLAVAGIIVALYLASRIVLRYSFASSTGPYVHRWWDPQAFVIVAVAGVLFIGLASLLKAQTLRKGGSAVAEMLGGRRVLPFTEDLAEKRLLNVVEEMAIASGVPVPAVYLLENEEGINAFAAGHTPNDAAVAVTRGMLRHLRRAELQGVIGHEFSHILNGDMRLNIRLIGILFGIFAIGIIGRILLRVGGGSRRGGSKKGAPVIAIAGILLVLIGYIGTFVGRLIQAAVSRQREHLADSSSVQFTRNPSGLAGALKKIGALSEGSRIRSPKAEQASHLFFSTGVRIGFLSGALATHPPLVERVRRLDPSFDGVFPAIEAAAPVERAEPPPKAARGLEDLLGPVILGGSVAVEPATIRERVGNPDENDPRVGAALLALIPQAVRSKAAAPEGAVALISALFLDPSDEERAKQLALLGKVLSSGEIETIGAAREELRGLDPRARLPLADLAAPALRDLEPVEREKLLMRIDALVDADATVSLFEFTLRQVVARRLLRAARPVDRIRFRSLGPLLGDVSVLLGAIAREGSGGDAAAARSAFESGASRIGDLGRASLPFRPEEKTDFPAVGKALERLAEASFPVREKVVEAVAHSALADQVVTLEEAELVRAVSTSLDCPIPPFPPGSIPAERPVS